MCASFHQLSSFIASEMQRIMQACYLAFNFSRLRFQLFTERTQLASQLSFQINNIEMRVVNLENWGKRAAALPPVEINNLAAEIQDRIYRARNLFIYGFAEVNIDPAHDLQYTTQLLSCIAGIDLSGLTVCRNSI